MNGYANRGHIYLGKYNNIREGYINNDFKVHQEDVFVSEDASKSVDLGQVYFEHFKKPKSSKLFWTEKECLSFMNAVKERSSKNSFIYNASMTLATATSKVKNVKIWKGCPAPILKAADTLKSQVTLTDDVEL